MWIARKDRAGIGVSGMAGARGGQLD